MISSENELKTVFAKVQKLAASGAEMDPLRQLADKRPADMEAETYQQALRDAGRKMRELQTKARKLRNHADALLRDDNRIVAGNLRDAAGAVYFLVSLSQIAYRNHLGPYQQFIENVKQETGWE